MIDVVAVGGFVDAAVAAAFVVVACSLPAAAGVVVDVDVGVTTGVHDYFSSSNLFAVAW